MTQHSIKAIETHYAGCRFRSRLEARWAVFFDHLAIRWHYEEQGYELPSGRYLPDFRIEGVAASGLSDRWVEVKGTLDEPGAMKVLLAAAELSPGEYPWISQRLLLLGDIPRPGKHAAPHVRLDLLGDDTLIRSRTVFRTVDSGIYVTAVDEPDIIPLVDLKGAALGRRFHLQLLCRDFDNQSPLAHILRDTEVNDAYRAARSARFEFGESGA